MKILFIHQNFPAQFNQLAAHLAAQKGNEVFALKQPPEVEFENVVVLPYRFLNDTQKQIHPLLDEMEAKVLRGEAVAEAALRLKNKGWHPDVIVGHTGWGELLFIRDIWPAAKLVVYCEYYYHAQGQDFNFDPEFQDLRHRTIERMKMKNTVMLSALAEADVAYTPTQWQRQTFPAHLRDRIDVIHEGIDTDYFQPDAKAFFHVANKNITLRAGDEVITYAARSLEPVRGFHQFMRALPDILAKRPNAHVVIMGHEKTSYGLEPEDFGSWQDKLLAEVGHLLDPQRVHFTGFLPKEHYRKVLQVSKVHVYLTYPFLLSWSMLDAMACGALVVGSDTGPVTEIITHGENGFTVPFFDTEKLVQTIAAQLKIKPHKTKSIKASARQWITTNFNRGECVKNMIELISSNTAKKVDPSFDDANTMRLGETLIRQHQYNDAFYLYLKCWTKQFEDKFLPHCLGVISECDQLIVPSKIFLSLLRMHKHKQDVWMLMMQLIPRLCEESLMSLLDEYGDEGFQLVRQALPNAFYHAENTHDWEMPLRVLAGLDKAKRLASLPVLHEALQRHKTLVPQVSRSRPFEPDVL